VHTEMGTMNTDGIPLRKRALVSVGILFLTFLGLFCGCNRHPTDAQLAIFFSEYESALTNLVSNLQKDSEIERLTWRRGVLSFDPSGSSTNGKVQTYTSLVAGFPNDMSIVSFGGGKQVFVYLSSRGISVSGSAKGLIYQESAPDRIVVDTDAEAQANRPFSVFNRVGRNWYIFRSQ